MIKVGTLKVTTTRSEDYVIENTYVVIETSVGEKKVVGYGDTGTSTTRLMWGYDIDLTNNDVLDDIFNNMGTNTYEWTTPLTEIPDSGTGSGISILDVYPRGTVYTTADTSFDPNTAWGGTWQSSTVSGKKQWLRTA